jgi:hypothetical protein
LSHTNGGLFMKVCSQASEASEGAPVLNLIGAARQLTKAILAKDIIN